MITDSYKTANQSIAKHCKKMSELLLVKIDIKRVYEGTEFEDDQGNVAIHFCLFDSRTQESRVSIFQLAYN